MPFSLSVCEEPKALDEMTKEEFDTMLQESYEQSLRGEGVPLEEFFAELKRGLQP